jgi:hypothetical protein
MKRCVTCQKEIVDAAVNCLFCGSKQTPDPAMKKTVMGYGTADVWKDKPPPLAPPLATPAPATPRPVVVVPPVATVPAQVPGQVPGPDAAPVTPLHQLYPFEPWARSLRLIMIVFGALLLLALLAPRKEGDEWLFAWQALANGQVSFGAIFPLAVAFGGLLAVVFGLIPAVPVVRGVMALVVGLGAILVPLFQGTFAWRPLASGLAPILLGAGVLVCAAYPAALAGRIVTTLGALALLATHLVPEGGRLPILNVVDLFKAGTLGMILQGAFQALMLLVALACLALAWLKAAAAAGTALAWLAISLGPGSLVLGVLVEAGGEAFSHPDIFRGPVIALALSALAMVGGATLIGKGCERPA